MDTISRKEQIITTSAKLFRQKGFEAASMRDIAAELGIEAASLYSHIKSKDEILETICFRMADELIKAIDEVNDVYFNAEEKLATAIKNHVKIVTDDLDSSTVFLREWRRLPAGKLAEFVKLRNKYEDGFMQILINGENENVFEAPDKKFAVLTILSAVNWITEWYSPKGNMTPDEISVHLYRFITTGLRVKAAV
ncbi:MAG TPA: TetR/AcrR family transcriptional regulator [Ignavibacteria bacterium]|nr:TetR/AcrR family transcriptional regulator [Ignavibacteria bacterium]HMR00401.1 TetR/AcrR family transcriptional regulator [Ignavibacteria bacterium]